MRARNIIGFSAVLLFICFQIPLTAEIPFKSYIKRKEVPLLQFSPASGFTAVSKPSDIQTKLSSNSVFSTHSLEIQITGENPSLNLSIPQPQTVSQASDSWNSALSILFSASGKHKLTLNVIITFSDGSVISNRNISVYPGEWRLTEHKNGPLPYPSSIRVELNAPPGTSLYIDSMFLETTSYDLQKFHETLDFQPQVWKQALSDSSTADLREIMEILVRLNSVSSAMLLSSVLEQGRNGLIAYPYLQRLSPVLREYVAEQGLKSKRPGPAYIAAALLKGCTEWKAVKFLQSYADAPDKVREFMIQQLCAMAHHPLLSVYSSFLKHKSSVVKNSALQALALIRSSSTIPDIVPLLDDPVVSLQAVHALGATGKPSTINHLLKAVENPLLAETAAEYLETFDLREYLNTVSRLAESEYPEVRGSAAALLKTTIESVPVRTRVLLGNLIKDPVPSVRIQAAESFGFSDDADNLAYLHEALDDTNGAVVVSAIRSLGQIGKYNSLSHLTAHRAKGNPLTFYAANDEIGKMHGPDKKLSPSAIGSFFLKDQKSKPEATLGKQDMVFFKRPIGRSVVSSSRPLVGETLTENTFTAFILPGFIEPVTFSVHSPVLSGEQRIAVSDFTSGNGGTLSGGDISVYIEEEHEGSRYLEKRSFLYTMKPETSRRIWLFLKTGETHPAGSYSGSVTIGKLAKISIVLHVLPWKTKSVLNNSFVINLTPPSTKLETELLTHNFPRVFLPLFENFEETPEGIPAFIRTKKFLQNARTPVIIDLSSVSYSSPRGSRTSYTFHAAPVHAQRMVKTVAELQDFCFKNSLPLPLYMISSNPYILDTAEIKIIRNLQNLLRGFTGVKTVSFRDNPNSDIIISKGPDLELIQRESARKQGQQVITYTPPGSSLEDIRKKAGLYQWITESDGNVLGYTGYSQGKQITDRAIPLELIMASEGIKDLEYLIILEQIISRSKNRETNPQRIKMMLEVEKELFTLKNGLLPAFSNKTWKSIDIDKVRTYLMRSSLFIFLGVQP